MLYIENMGVDFYKCGRCQECMHSDCFEQCYICCDHLEYDDDLICDACHEDHIVKIKNIDIEKIKKDHGKDFEFEYDYAQIHMGKGKKPKKYESSIVICDCCLKKYKKHT